MAYKLPHWLAKLKGKGTTLGGAVSYTYFYEMATALCGEFYFVGTDTRRGTGAGAGAVPESIQLWDVRICAAD